MSDPGPPEDPARDDTAATADDDGDDVDVDVTVDADVDAEPAGDTPPDCVVETVTSAGVRARYVETEPERRLVFDTDERTAVIAQNREGYAMLKVRPSPDGDELERYYGFDMALDHAAELLGVDRHALPVPDAAADMGM